MTISKGGNQEAPAKTRVSSKVLNPDAPEFNPSTKSTGKLNADAPEFVPGQFPPYDSVFLNVQDIKDGYKNCHVPGYRISHQEQYIPLWLSQSYPMGVPYQQVYPNAPYEYIPYDYTRQTQNYPIQRNVYPSPVHSEYQLNVPYNVVVQGKSKLNKAKTKPQGKEPTLSRETSKEVKEKNKNGTAVGSRDTVPGAPKDGARDAVAPPTKDVVPEPPKTLTWAERTKLSNMRQMQKPTVAPSMPPAAPVPTTTVTKDAPRVTRDSAKPAAKERARDHHKEKHRETQRETHKEHAVQKEVPVKPEPKKEKKEEKVKEEKEEISYAKVFKEAVKSLVVSNSVAKAVPAPPAPPVLAPVVAVVPPVVAPPVVVQVPVAAEPLLDLKETDKDSAADAATTASAKDTPPAVCKELNKDSSYTTTDSSGEESPLKDSTDFGVYQMLGYYLHLTKNKKMEEIREKFSLPVIKFKMATASTNANQNKSGYKDRERDTDMRRDRDRDKDRDKSDKIDKKDWRHKGYDKSYGNYRYNKEYSRNSSEYTPTPIPSESSWLVKLAKQRNDKDAQFKRKIMGLLNRLTVEKFGLIYDQIMECGIKTAEKATMLVNFVFGKAVNQHHFIPMYVDLCSRLSKDLYRIPNFKSQYENADDVDDEGKEDVDSKGLKGRFDDDLVADSDGSLQDDVDDEDEEEDKLGDDLEEPRKKKKEKSHFTRILLNCTQDSFEQNLRPLEIPSELEGDERFEYEQRYKHRMRGNMIFVGELFKQKLLASRLLLMALDDLFVKREDCIALYGDLNMGDNHLEGVCTLLQTIGRAFNNKVWRMSTEFNDRVDRLAELGKNEKISFRIRCLIKNVLENRMGLRDRPQHQEEDQPCKLDELRHKHSFGSFNMLNTNQRSDRHVDRHLDRDDGWKMRNRRGNKSGSTSNLNRFDRREMNRGLTKEHSMDKFYRRRDRKGVEFGDFEHRLKTHVEEASAQEDSQDESICEKSSSASDEVRVDAPRVGPTVTFSKIPDLGKETGSIVSELTLSHDVEESTLRVDELELESDKQEQLYKMLVVACMEKCSKVGAEKETEVVTKWIVQLAKDREATTQLVNGLHEFVFGSTENSMSMMVEDYPLLPTTLATLVENMRVECQHNDKFKHIEAHLKS